MAQLFVYYGKMNSWAGMGLTTFKQSEKSAKDAIHEMAKDANRIIDERVAELKAENEPEEHKEIDKFWDARKFRKIETRRDPQLLYQSASGDTIKLIKMEVYP